MQMLFTEFINILKKIFLGKKNNVVCTYYGKQSFVPPAGLSNQGLRKKSMQNIGFLPGENFLRQEVFFLWAARSNWRYIESVLVN